MSQPRINPIAWHIFRNRIAVYPAITSKPEEIITRVHRRIYFTQDGSSYVKRKIIGLMTITECCVLASSKLNNDFLSISSQALAFTFP